MQIVTLFPDKVDVALLEELYEYRLTTQQSSAVGISE